MFAHRARMFFSITLVVVFVSSCATATPSPSPVPTAMSSAIFAPAPSATPTSATHWPTQGWRTSTPEQQGIDSERLVRMLEYVRRYSLDLHSILIVRNGYLVMEAYWNPFQPDTKHFIASCTKSITSALIGIAIGQGYIDGVDHKVLDWFPEQKTTIDDPGKRAITLEHLLTMSSGLQWFEAVGNPVANSTQMQRTTDWVQFVLDRPMWDDPGTRMVYNSGGSHLLSAIITKTTGKSALAFAQTNLFAPLGITDVLWSADPNGISYGGAGLVMKPRDMAKVGYLYLNKGVWEGKQLVPAEWVKASGTQHIRVDGGGVSAGHGYGYQWWIPPFGGYAAEGFAGQRIYVLPEQNMVLVFTSALKSRASTSETESLVSTFILPAAHSSSLPENPPAVARLQAQLDTIAKPQPAPVPPLPALAQTVSGRTYRLDTNAFGINAVRFDFAKEQATLGITTRGQTQQWAIGLDNVYGITKTGGSFYDSVALRGSWKDETTFVLDLIQNGNPYSMQFEFDEKQEKLVILYRGLTNYLTMINGTLEK